MGYAGVMHLKNIVHTRRSTTVGSDGVIWVYLLGSELLSNLVFEGSRSCGDLVCGCGFNSVFEPDACDDFSEVIKAA